MRTRSDICNHSLAVQEEGPRRNQMATLCFPSSRGMSSPHSKTCDVGSHFTIPTGQLAARCGGHCSPLLTSLSVARSSGRERSIPLGPESSPARQLRRGPPGNTGVGLTLWSFHKQLHRFYSTNTFCFTKEYYVIFKNTSKLKRIRLTMIKWHKRR